MSHTLRHSPRTTVTPIDRAWCPQSSVDLAGTQLLSRSLRKLPITQSCSVFGRAAIGHPIWGDVKYNRFYKRGTAEEDKVAGPGAEGEEAEEKAARDMSGVAFTPDLKHACMCLWALELRWRHPSTGADVVASVEEPPWYASLRRCEAQRRALPGWTAP